MIYRERLKKILYIFSSLLLIQFASTVIIIIYCKKLSLLNFNIYNTGLPKKRDMT